MPVKSLLAIALVVFGMVVIGYSGLSFTTPGKTVEILGMKLQSTEHHYIPPVVGLVSVIAGVVLLLINPKPVA